ncbi:uncharacterized protein LOC123707715 [Pieris brassicae]|uniref:uncharacterized protein LOC123707715 n=1 Tax=Pieris brassicae TaxID=7116 RepID=UPI001E661F34|nr:uncharacterized protein LOC123707715 [Pieris brassicae]
MDCCKWGPLGAGAGWAGGRYAAPPYAPQPSPYPPYYPHAHDYARYYRYDYPAPHAHHAEHAMPMDYGAYALKESRGRRALTRREQRIHPALQQFPVSHTPPLECGMTNRGHGYCEPHVWPHYQMGVLAGSGWNGTNGGVWPSRVPQNMCSRESMRYGPDCRLMQNTQNHIGAHDGRSTPYPVYDTGYESKRGSNDFPMRVPPAEVPQPVRETVETRPPEVVRPPVVPLPAFQQAFGSTEIGKFAEAFSRADLAHETDECENFAFEPFAEWEGSPDQWTPPVKEIKCEDTF